MNISFGFCFFMCPSELRSTTMPAIMISNLHVTDPRQSQNSLKPGLALRFRYYIISSNSPIKAAHTPHLQTHPDIIVGYISHEVSPFQTIPIISEEFPDLSCVLSRPGFPGQIQSCTLRSWNVVQWLVRRMAQKRGVNT